MAKTTLFYPYFKAYYSYKITFQWTSRKRKNLFFYIIFFIGLLHNNMKVCPGTGKKKKKILYFTYS